MDSADLDSRFSYNPPKDEATKNRHHSIRTHCYVLAEIINKTCPDGREKSTAMSRLEEVLFWSIAAIAEGNQ